MIRRKSIVLGIASFGLAAGLGYAIRAAASGIPATNALSYAGVLEDASGSVSGTHNIGVTLYDAATAGTQLCQVPSIAVQVQAGRFNIPLPDACTTAVKANPNAWIDVQVDGASVGRTKIGAVPYAVEANHTPNADNATTATTANAAGGALQVSISQMQSTIAALQGQPAPLTTLTKDFLNTTDPPTKSWQGFATECIKSDTSSGAVMIDACFVAASRKCSQPDGLGYKTGWPTGELGTGVVQIVCIK